MPIRHRKNGELFSVYRGCLVVALLALACCGCNRSEDVRSPSNVPLRRLYESEFRLTPSGPQIRRFVFSPNGQLLAGSNWSEIRLWTFPEGKLLHDFSGMAQGDCIGFSADGKEFLVLDQRRKENEIVRFDTASGKVQGKTKLLDIEKEQGATNFSFSNDGRWLCMTEVYGNCAVWDAITGKKQFRKKIGGSTIRDNILTFYNGAWIEQYDVRTGEEISSKRSRYQLRDLVRNSSGRIWAGYSEEEKAIVFWDFDKDELVGMKMPIDWHEWYPQEAAISDDGKLFAYFTDADKPMPDRKDAVFDISSGKIVCTFEPKPSMYFTDKPLFSPDGRYVFLAGDCAVFVPVDIATGKPVHEVPDHILAVTELSFTPDGKPQAERISNACQC
jgi:WD40 repeat protein